ncbi:ABC transporter C-terminal domain-containing protein [Neobacillus cucumis]|uniref:ABC transporter C-terminal domain-containing protein n=1 Tax=Neobacillus cucumis TaxID=1740721 RepID=UPI002E1C7087|nr:ABC transporter C-terminal domain-containing protein [Neobacillus cucumis]
MIDYFTFDERLGIHVPDLMLEWDKYCKDTQQFILLNWERVRGTIPDRIAELEQEINHKQAKLSDESDFPRSCKLNTEIADLASIINDLWLYYRADQTISTKVHQ